MKRAGEHPAPRRNGGRALDAPPRPHGQRLLVVKLADFGDALLTTPALDALREALPTATIDVLTTPAGAAVYRHVGGIVDTVNVLDTRPFVRRIPRASDVRRAVHLVGRLRARRYDALLSMHSLATRRGVLKHAAVAAAIGARRRYGLAAPGSWRGFHLSDPVVDAGYDRAHVAASMLAVAGAFAPEIDSGDRRPARFDPGAAGRESARLLIEGLDAGGRPLVALHPGAGPYSPTRRWPAERFAALVDRLVDDGLAVLVVGTAQDDTAAVVGARRAPVFDLGDRTDLPTLGALLERVAAYVGNDSGVSHLAVAMGAPSVLLFGPTNEVAWGPWSPCAPAQVVSVPVPCRPCAYVGHGLGDPRGCPTRDCLRWLDVATVRRAVHEVVSDAATADTRGA